MLSSDYLFTIADTISEMYEELNTSIINDMARRISKMDYASETTIWQAQRAIESGALYDDIVKRISEQTGKSQEELQKIFKEAGIENLKNNLRMAGMPVNDMKISERTANILISGLNKTGGVLKNLTLTTAIDTQNQFIYATDLAYSQLISGAFDYNTVIRRTIKELASQGICTVDYKTGYRQKIDSAVRNVVLTGVNQTTGPMTEMQRLEVGADGYETTAHGGARPEHQIWQGKQFYADIPVKGYEDFKSATGYGTVTGLKGANCRHDFFWVFLGQDKPSYTTSELKALNNKTVEYNGKKMTVYDAQSKMREMERTVRAWKRQSNALNAAGLDNSFEKQKVKEWTNKYKDFTNKTGLRKQNERLVVYDKNVMTKREENDIINVENLLTKLNINENEYVPFGKYDPFKNDIQEQSAELLGMGGLPKFVSNQEYSNNQGTEIVRVVHAYHGKTAQEAYDNTLRGTIQYSESVRSSYGRGIYFGDSSIEGDLLSLYGKTDSKIIKAKISNNAKILEFDKQFDYLKDVEERLNKIPEKLRNVYKNERSLLYMLDGIDGIKIKSKGYYCIYNRGVLIINV